MKKIIICFSLIVIVLISSSAYVLRYSSGIAGYTASPGEMSCNFCHGEGSIDSTAFISLSTTPLFSNNSYSPGAIYDVSIHIGAMGYSKFGFGCEILNSLSMSVGSLQAIGTGVQLLNAGNRVNVAHTGPKSGNNQTVFSFQWLAPDSGEGAVTFYIAGNSVNGDHSISGDFPIPPVSITLDEGVAVTPTVITTNLNNHDIKPLSELFIYPNPIVSGITNLTYFLHKPQLVVLELLDIQGNILKVLLKENQLYGHYSKVVDISDMRPGIYFLRVVTSGQKSSQKLIIVQ